MYESNNANFDDMGCTWNAGHVIGMSSLTPRGKPCMNEKAGKMVMKVKLCKARPIKRISKSYAYLIIKKN